VHLLPDLIGRDPRNLIVPIVDTRSVMLVVPPSRVWRYGISRQVGFRIQRNSQVTVTKQLLSGITPGEFPNGLVPAPVVVNRMHTVH
jgi:hypothetical protein